MQRLAFLVLLAGCSDVLDFDVTQEIPPQTIAGSPVPAILGGFFEVPLTVDIQAQIEAQETGPIDSVTLTSLRLDITSADDDWDFLDGCDIYVHSTKSGTTLPEVKVAGVAAPGPTMTLTFTPVPGVNLLGYVQEGCQMTADATGNAPPDDVTFDGTAVFTVHPL